MEKISDSKIELILQDLELTYENWLLKLDSINCNIRYSGKPKLSASSAGLCHLKHYFKMKEMPKLPVDRKSLKKMRLGTIVHEDVQKSLEYFFNDYEIICELPVRYKSVKGHIDIVVKVADKKCILIDIKTMAAYSWSLKYGRKANKDAAKWSKLQLATYALGLMETYGYEEVYMYLWNYNKNNSDMRFESIDPEYVKIAADYWNEAELRLKSWEDIKYDDMKWETINAPEFTWECRYCDYANVCPKKISK